MHSKFSHRFSCIWAIYERSVNTACASWALTNRHHCAVHPTNLLRKYNMLQLCTTQATLLGKISPTGLTKFKEISRDCRHSELVLCHNNIRQKQKKTNVGNSCTDIELSRTNVKRYQKTRFRALPAKMLYSNKWCQLQGNKHINNKNNYNNKIIMLMC